MLIAASAILAWHMWREVEGAVISTHGLMALVLGVSATLLLAITLIGLVLFSSRRGFDDEAGNP